MKTGSTPTNACTVKVKYKTAVKIIVVYSHQTILVILKHSGIKYTIWLVNSFLYCQFVAQLCKTLPRPGFFFDMRTFYVNTPQIINW